jgi:hypothetical protein
MILTPMCTLTKACGHGVSNSVLDGARFAGAYYLLFWFFWLRLILAHLRLVVQGQKYMYAVSTCTEATVTVTEGSVALPKTRLVTVTMPPVAFVKTVTWPGNFRNIFFLPKKCSKWGEKIANQPQCSSC